MCMCYNALADYKQKRNVGETRVAFEGLVDP